MASIFLNFMGVIGAIGAIGSLFHPEDVGSQPGFFIFSIIISLLFFVAGSSAG